MLSGDFSSGIPEAGRVRSPEPFLVPSAELLEGPALFCLGLRNVSGRSA